MNAQGQGSNLPFLFAMVLVEAVILRDSRSQHRASCTL